MQEVIQAQADRIADRFGIAHVIVQRFAGLDEAERVERMRHEMAHAIHQAKGGEGNLHGHEWRLFAKRVGCKPAIGSWEKGGKKVARQARQVRVNQNPRTEAEWRAYIRANNLPLLGRGASRETYALDDKRVIKLDYGHWEQCGSEAKRWNEANAEVRQYLAAVLDSGHRWNIMERATKVLGKFDHETQWTVKTDLRETVGAVFGIGDLHEGNIGYFSGGRFKIIDYAL